MGTVATSYSTGTVTGAYCGGLVGRNESSVTNCYSRCAVTGLWCAGGLVGVNRQSNWPWAETWYNATGTIDSCYSSGPVTGDNDAGGLVGSSRFEGESEELFPAPRPNPSFWDIENSGQATSDGGTGLTTAEMQTAATFLEAGWDFIDETENGTDDIWKIAEGLDYPRLWWEPYDGQITAELGQTFAVTLESNPSIGYRWEWGDSQDSILEQVGEAEFKPRETGDPPLVGAGGWEIFTFEAVSPGQMILELVYRRPWEEGVEPLKIFSLQVVVPDYEEIGVPIEF